METRCSICGKKVELPKTHKDFQKLKANPQITYICDLCSERVRFQAQEDIKPKKPI